MSSIPSSGAIRRCAPPRRSPAAAAPASDFAAANSKMSLPPCITKSPTVPETTRFSTTPDASEKRFPPLPPSTPPHCHRPPPAPRPSFGHDYPNASNHGGKERVGVEITPGHAVRRAEMTPGRAIEHIDSVVGAGPQPPAPVYPQGTALV